MTKRFLAIAGAVSLAALLSACAGTNMPPYPLPEDPGLYAIISEDELLRLDGDLYESTIDALTHLYPKLEKGGYAIIDDYGSVKACKQATEDYRAAHDIEEPIITIDSSGVMWRKESKRRA